LLHPLPRPLLHPLPRPAIPLAPLQTLLGRLRLVAWDLPLPELHYMEDDGQPPAGKGPPVSNAPFYSPEAPRLGLGRGKRV
jgi:hypothetical protein